MSSLMLRALMLRPTFQPDLPLLHQLVHPLLSSGPGSMLFLLPGRQPRAPVSPLGQSDPWIHPHYGPYPIPSQNGSEYFKVWLFF